MEIEVTQADYDAAARLNGYANWSVFKAAPQHDAEWMELCAHDFARHRQAAFADGFSAALQGAEAAIWRIEDDSFLYENVSKARQEGAWEAGKEINALKDALAQARAEIAELKENPNEG